KPSCKGKTRNLRCGHFFSWYPVDLFVHEFFRESNSFQDTFPVLDHVWMSAQITDRITSSQAPEIGVFAQDIIYASGFARPFLIVPRTADRRNVFQPWHFRCKFQ